MEPLLSTIDPAVQNIKKKNHQERQTGETKQMTSVELMRAHSEILCVTDIDYTWGKLK